MSVPNQKIVKIKKDETGFLYTKITLDALEIAMATLKECGLKMWLYLNKNQAGFQLELSPKACESWGLKKSSYYRGLEELREHGYLVPIAEGSDIYYFYEFPRK